MVCRLSLFILAWVAATALCAQDAGVDAVFASLPAGQGEARAYVRLMTDNVEAWHARWYILEHAAHRIDCTTFILEDDVFGKAFMGLLEKKAAEGVGVRLMLDSRGCKSLVRQFGPRDCLAELMKCPNVSVKTYNPLHSALVELPTDLRDLVASNHDKLLIVDGEWLITGGRNIASKYLADPADRPDVFRDTDVLVRGASIAGQAEHAFDEEFNRQDNGGDAHAWLSGARPNAHLETACLVMRDFLATGMLGAPEPTGQTSAGALLRSLTDELGRFPHSAASHLGPYSRYQPFWGDRAVPVRLLDKTSRLGQSNEITPNLVRFFDAARQSILIENPYIILTDTARAALKRASVRGVAIRMVTNGPDSFDHLATQSVFLGEWPQMLRELPTCRIWVYKGPATIHAKVFGFDDRVAAVGSYNMDPLSETINGEEICVIQSPAFATRSRLRVEKDLENAVEYTIERAPDGSVRQLVGPAPDAAAQAARLRKYGGFFSLLRPVL